MYEPFDTKCCFNRLPCGICTRTNAMCPFYAGQNTKVYDGTAIDPEYKDVPSITTNTSGECWDHIDSTTDRGKEVEV